MNNIPSINPINFKLKTSCRNQYEFRSFCLDDLIPDDHKARIIWDFVDNMDLSACFMEIMSYQCKPGRSTIDPKILLALWIYTIIDGNSSARKLEELCKNHNVYKWICGGVTVNRTTLAEFRSKDPRKFDELLTRCLAVLIQNDLISDSDFSQDGTRVKASAGNNSYHREDSLKALEAKLTIHIEQLRKDEKLIPDAYEKKKNARNEQVALEKKKRVQSAIKNLYAARSEKITNSKRNHNAVTEKELEEVRASTTDPEVRRMKMGDSGYRLAYNVQFATGLDSRVIYGVDVVNTLDPGTAPRLMAQVEERLKNIKLGKIKNWIADAAYSSKNEIITVAGLFVDCFYFAPPSPRKGVDPKKHQKDDCEALKKWRDAIGSDQVKDIYKKRCSTAEFSNMHVKNAALKGFSVRGLIKAKGMAFLHAIVMNVARYLNFLKTKKTE